MQLRPPYLVVMIKNPSQLAMQPEAIKSESLKINVLAMRSEPMQGKGARCTDQKEESLYI